ncbi:MAG TPA: hypothetical protein EYO82_07990 [Gammaproteobacteria bacterium]|nr:hypothetical protein [Gammaproteobacteria bacterium]
MVDQADQWEHRMAAVNGIARIATRRPQAAGSPLGRCRARGHTITTLQYDIDSPVLATVEDYSARRLVGRSGNPSSGRSKR